MNKTTLQLNDRLYEYLLSVSLREHPVLEALREETARLEMAIMQISPDQGQFMTLITKLIGAKKILEIGTFTGYSALAMALALPQDGHMVACDVSEEWTAIAKKYWRQAGVAGKIQLHLAPAKQTLKHLLQQGHGGEFDLAFIDADKPNQLHYYEYCLKLLRPGGLILVDNVLWGGSVADDGNHTEETEAIREFNRFLHQDERVDIAMVAVGDGITMARIKS